MIASCNNKSSWSLAKALTTAYIYKMESLYQNCIQAQCRIINLRELLVGGGGGAAPPPPAVPGHMNASTTSLSVCNETTLEDPKLCHCWSLRPLM